MNVGFSNMYIEPEALPHPGVQPEETKGVSPVRSEDEKTTQDDKGFPWWLVIVAGGIYVLQK